jgi:hypothetical protein
LGREDKDFEFEHLKPIKVEFAESTAFNRDEASNIDLSQIEKWLFTVA